MSDNLLLFIPVAPSWRPSRDAAEGALQTLRSMAPCNDDISAEFYDEVRFHTGMGNWSGVVCPACGRDIEDWFFRTVDAAYVDCRFANLEAVVPCCKTPSSLNDLGFVWPAGFSVFALEAMNPGFLPTPEQIAAIEHVLGSKCRVIWEHI